MNLAVAIGTGEWIIIAIVLVLLFGATQLPKLARSLGIAQKEFRKGLSEDGEDSADGAGSDGGGTDGGGAGSASAGDGSGADADKSADSRAGAS